MNQKQKLTGHLLRDYGFQGIKTNLSKLSIESDAIYWTSINFINGKTLLLHKADNGFKCCLIDNYYILNEPMGVENQVEEYDIYIKNIIDNLHCIFTINNNKQLDVLLELGKTLHEN